MRYNHGVGKAGYIAALFVMPAALFLVSHLTALADGVSWAIDAAPSFAVDEVQKSTDPPVPCTRLKAYLGGDFVKSDACIIDRGDWRYGEYSYAAPGTAYTESGYAISFGNDANMYRLRGVSSLIPAYQSDTMIFKTSYPSFHPVLNVVRNFPSKLIRVANPYDNAPEYEFRQQPDLTLKQPNGITLDVGGVGVSPNGKWLAAEVQGKGIVRVNLETLEVKKISSLAATYWRGLNPSVEFAVSNDGNHVAAMGLNFFTSIIDVTDECGDTITDDATTNALKNPCKDLNLNAYLSDKVSRFSYGYYPTFDEGAGRLNFLAGSYDGSIKWVTVGAPGYSPPAQLDYLALGDSYSSGEGDTENNLVTGQRYYLPFTNIAGTSTTPEEKCHVSSRSYPFLLQQAMNVPSYLMKSVACSGAVGRTDYAQSNDGYKGQNDRLSVLNDASKVDQYKTTALNEFIPGRDQQIEFVKKYQPKAITLTAGGNDVDFGGVAFACAPPNVPLLPPTSRSFSCDYASTDRGKAHLGSAISEQYKKLTQLYRQLHNASPETKIYVIGYPQFFSTDNLLPCAPNVAFDRAERTMARAAVSYLNDVIEAAAKTAGVKYVDIESSLGDHVLCGSGESYVTGLASSGKQTLNIPELFSQESFHPNAEGHQAIAAAIQAALNGQTLTAYNYCPDHTVTSCPDTSVTTPQPTSYFAVAMAGDSTNYTPATMVKKVIQKGKDSLVFSLSDLEPSSLVNIKVFSNPTDLGTYDVDDQGRLSVSVPIPSDLPAGFHTLEVSAKTFSGEPITFWQIVEVHGPDGDIDENGVPDSYQECLLVPAAGVDYDADGIDDACDSEIGPAPVVAADPSPASDDQAYVGTGPDDEQPKVSAVAAISQNGEQNRRVSPVASLMHFFGSGLDANWQGSNAYVSYKYDEKTPSSEQPSAEPSSQPPIGKPAQHLHIVFYGILVAGIVLLFVGQWLVRRHNKK